MGTYALRLLVEVCSLSLNLTKNTVRVPQSSTVLRLVRRRPSSRQKSFPAFFCLRGPPAGFLDSLVWCFRFLPTTRGTHHMAKRRLLRPGQIIYRTDSLPCCAIQCYTILYRTMRFYTRLSLQRYSIVKILLLAKIVRHEIRAVDSRPRNAGPSCSIVQRRQGH